MYDQPMSEKRARPRCARIASMSSNSPANVTGRSAAGGGGCAAPATVEEDDTPTPCEWLEILLQPAGRWHHHCRTVVANDAVVETQSGGVARVAFAHASAHGLGFFFPC